MTKSFLKLRPWHPATIFLIVILAYAGCSDDPVIPPPPDQFANCKNDTHLTELDTIMHRAPAPTYHISRLTVSTYNGWWAGEYQMGIPGTGVPKARGIFLYDPVSDSPLATYQTAEWHEWSPDGRSLLLIIGSDIWIVDVPSLVLRKIYDWRTDSLATWFATWALDGRRVFVSRPVKKNSLWPLGTYVMNADGSERKLVTTKIWYAKQLDEGSLISITSGIIFQYDIDSDSLYRFERPLVGVRSAGRSIRDYDILRNRDYVVVHSRWADAIFNHQWNPLFMLDTKTWTLRQIREAQRWDVEYLPTRAGPSSFYATVFCRTDSSSMVWEFDMKGNPIKQVTTKTMNVWKY